MPDRVIRQGIITSEAINSLTWGGEVFYRRLMSVADDYGRFDGRLTIIRAGLYALKLNSVSEPDIGKWLRECEQAGLVRCYQTGGKRYIEVTKWDQRARGKPRYPPPDDPQQVAASRGELLPSAAYSSTSIEYEGESARARPPENLPELPTTGEVCQFGSMGAGIPADYCEHYHAKKTETNGWIKNGTIVLWKLEIKRWWEGDKGTWRRNGANGKLVPKRGPNPIEDCNADGSPRVRPMR